MQRLMTMEGDTAPRYLTMLIWALGGSAALAISAKVSVPFVPVPMTLQTMCVLGLGLTGGSCRAGGAVFAYLLEGCLGLPVFAGNPGAGVVCLFGPTGGYLVGFAVAAVISGRIAENDNHLSVIRALFSALIGSLIIDLLGVAWLSTFVGVKGALMHGYIPFAFGDITKAVFAGLLASALRIKRGA